MSKDQPDMMVAMMNYNPVAISLFTISWTIGMAAPWIEAGRQSSSHLHRVADHGEI